MVESMIQNKRLLLIAPPFYQLYKETFTSNLYPLSLGYLASSVKKYTLWDVLVYNSDFSPEREPFDIEYFRGEGFSAYTGRLNDPCAEPWRKIKRLIADYRPSVLGISIKSPGIASALMVAKIARETDERIQIIAGGPHATIMKEKMFPEPLIDIIFMGEGEKRLPEILLCLENRGDLKHIKGIVYKKGGENHINPPATHIRNLDLLPFPFEHASSVLYDYHKYTDDCFGHIMATRGCIYNCSFCSSRTIWGRKVRFRSPENIIQEILMLKENHIESIHFEDDTFGVTPEYLKALTKEIVNNIPGLKWSCEIHVNLVTDANLELMKKSGCRLVKMGIESGNNQILKSIKKGFTIETAIKKCEMIKQYQMDLEVFFMAGFPEETEETMEDTYRAMEEIDCNKVIYSIFTPYSGTEAFACCSEKGRIPKDYNPALYNHQSPLNCFCGIHPERFKELSSRMEKLAGKKNGAYRRYQKNVYRKLQEAKKS
jgi:tRNA A37 methylthiotransferase MiaB